MALILTIIFFQAPVAEDEAFEDMEDSIAEIEESKITLRKRFTNCIESMCSNCLDGVFSKFEIFLESKWGPVEELSLYQNFYNFVIQLSNNVYI